LGRCQHSFKFNNNVQREIVSLGLFTVGFKLLQAYYEPLASNVRSANTAGEVDHTFSYYAQYSAR